MILPVTTTWITEAGMPHQRIPELAAALQDFARPAIRLPDASDADILTAVEAIRPYLADQTYGDSHRAPLIHNRLHLMPQLPEFGIWLPWSESLLTGAVEYEPDRHIAVSVHSLERAQLAVAIGATEVIYGHVFATESHPGEPGRGVDSLREIVRWCGHHAPDVLVTAIGGVTPDNVRSLGEIGCTSVAIIRAVTQSPDPAETLATLRYAWSQGLNNHFEKENQS